MMMYLLFLLYSLFLIGLSYFYGRQASQEEYLLSGRNRPTLHILASKFAGAVGVSTFITYTSYAYKFSAMGVIPLILGASVGYIGFALWAAPKIKRFSLGQQFYTQGDLVKFITINENSRLLTNVLTIAVQFFWVILALVGGAKIIAYFEVLSYEIALLSTSLVLLCYLLLSGFKAVILTDVVQTVIILSFLFFLVIMVLWNEPVEIASLLQTPPPQQVSVGNIIGLLLYGGLSVFGLADRYQLCYAAKDEEAARRGMALAVLPVLVVVFLLLMVGLSALAQNTSLDPDIAFLYAMEQFLAPFWYPVLLLLFFAGLMSSADTNIFAVASHAAFLSAAPNKVKATKQLTALVIVVATLIAYFWRDIVDISIIGAALRVTLAIPMIYIISRGNNTGRFMTATLLGVLALVVGWLFLGAEPILIPLIILAGMLGMLYKSKNDELYWS